MKLNKSALVVSALLGLTLSQHAYADVSGMVYQDLPVNGTTLNAYGVKDANELGVADVTVTAYQADGTSQTMVTFDDGLWTLATTGDVRVEFSTIPSYLKESPDGGNQNASVQFVADGETVDFGLHDASDYSDTVNPLYVNNLQQNGTHNGSTVQSLQTVHYDATDLNAAYQTGGGVQGIGEVPLDTIMMGEMGSVWGKAYQKDKKRLFVASMLQRHVGFAHSPADIYVTDYSSGLPSTLTGNFSLQGITPSNGGVAIDLGTVERSSGSDYLLYDNPQTQNIDLDAYAKVGKISYGGVDVDHANNQLWLVNLNQKGIISVDVSGDFNTLAASTINQYLIEGLPNAPICTGGYLRPWALKIHQGKGYLGALCDGAISKERADMQAFVLSFDLKNPSSGFTNELTFSLNYPRQLRGWYAWEDTYFDPAHPKAYNGVIYAEPVLSDIEFDEHNTMYLAFFDRYSTQLGGGNYKAISGTTETEGSYEYGEILRVCNTNGIYEVEGSGSCTQFNYTVLGINEFFNDFGGDRGRESSLGSLALLKGSSELLLGIVDPHPESTSGNTDSTYWFLQGEHTLSTIDGSIKNWYANAYTAASGLNGKANGMGDIELITAPAPVEVGNRVWVDVDADGIQDADEAGIAGIKVELVKSGSVISTVTTNVSGSYIFSNDPSKVSTASHAYNITELTPNTNYIVRIPNASGINKQAALGVNNLTTANTGEGASSNKNDSDGVSNGANAEAVVNASDISRSGDNNHSYDFGFGAAVSPSKIGLEINKTVSLTTVTSGEIAAYTIVVTNNGPSDATGIVVSDKLSAELSYVNNTASQGSYIIATGLWTVGALANGATATLTINVIVN